SPWPSSGAGPARAVRPFGGRRDGQDAGPSNGPESGQGGLMARLELHSITKRFGGQVAVQDFDLNVGDGELVTFLGPSGCGKTTTLRITAGFEFADEGRIVVNGQDITSLPANRRGMGM